MSERVERLREAVEEPFLILDPVNVRYLVGFESSNSGLLVERSRVLLFTDFRYAAAARTVDGVDFVETSRSLVADLAERLTGRVAFEADSVTYSGYETLAAGGLELLPTRGVVERLRAIKEDRELETIRQASALTSEAFERFSRERFLGRTERELAWRLDSIFHDLGGSSSFDTIVAAGANGSTPHAHSGEGRIEAGQTIVVDAGCALDGYCSDCTRTFATTPLPERLREAYAVCLAAQEEALGAIRPGISGIDADAVARAAITRAGFGDAFGHGLGHGVGMAIHEQPRLSTESEDVLSPGNVVTVEPGIYLEGLGGIRIEDLVIVTQDGAEVLTSFTKDLVTVD